MTDYSNAPTGRHLGGDDQRTVRLPLSDLASRLPPASGRCYEEKAPSASRSSGFQVISGPGVGDYLVVYVWRQHAGKTI